MRIIGGIHRGRALSPVGRGDPAAHLRPTTDRVREALFNVLSGGRFGDPVTGAHVLDLFAGTGALGLETLSRGAASVCFVESGRKAQAILRRNLTLLGVEGRIVTRDATRLGAAPRAFDLVFLDPPYGMGLGERAVEAALSQGWIEDGALIVWEEAAPPILPRALDPLDQRKYGDTHVTFARVALG
ncbi:16S rRNA (guanine(966)-N(2))-methyltransferase RsmD [Palleronia sp. LCG004]|uniref:16S rRNA (guanine(966)-N(2))-methyltransferase RsmD n=1 Tax=Palleronia sp. LCG004 TaxID=3079304 RepID=UPI002942E209|nr:16S rRNA (guanine(966)-N(2))-methyltransferase RsmD [Palleronia sp. LCG004]WOI56041.1 16S rRNA (guanine(966)-N(2))-methyltransferase RsmD [Palleronia sp. LCG004]